MAPVTVFFRVYRDEDRGHVKWFKFVFDSDSNSNSKVIKNGGWLDRPLSSVRQPLDSTVVGVQTPGRSFLYSIGGGESYNVQRFNTAAGSAGLWEECPSMKERRSVPQVVVMEGKIFVFGGFMNSSLMDARNKEFHTWAEFLDTEERYDDGWQSLTPELFGGGGSSSLFNLLNPGREKNFTFHVAKFNSSEILLSSGNSRSYLFNPSKASLREASVDLRIRKNYLTDTSPPIILFPRLRSGTEQRTAARRPIEVSFHWGQGTLFGRDMAEKDHRLSFVGCNNPIHSGLPYVRYQFMPHYAYIRSDCLHQPIKDRLHVFWAVEEPKRKRFTLYFRQISYTLSSVSPPLIMDGRITYARSFFCPLVSADEEFYLLDGVLL